MATLRRAPANGATSSGSPVFALSRVLTVTQALVATALLLSIGLLLLGVLPTFFGYESFAVYSGSMEPALKVGSLAVVKPTRSSDLKPGDIITYRTPTQPDLIVTHRLRAVEQTPDGKQQYRTKGDANDVEDLVLVEPSAVLGKVVYSVPYTGYSVEFARTNTGRLLVIVLPAVVLGLDVLRRRLMVRSSAAARGKEADARAAGENERMASLLARGWEALDAGHLSLAGRAADGVLSVEPRNEDAWLLKAESQSDARGRLTLLQTAQSINPTSTRIAQRLAELESSVGRGDGGGGSGHDAGERSHAAWR